MLQVFPAPVLESAISLGSPGSFVGNGVRNEGLSTGYAYVSWGVFASWPSQRGRAWNYISVYTHIYNHLSIYSSVSMLSCIWVHTFVSIAKSVFKWFTLAFHPALVYLQIPIPTAESYSNRIVALTIQLIYFFRSFQQINVSVSYHELLESPAILLLSSEK